MGLHDLRTMSNPNRFFMVDIIDEKSISYIVDN